jgi:hypothetical protein
VTALKDANTAISSTEVDADDFCHNTEAIFNKITGCC